MGFPLAIEIITTFAPQIADEMLFNSLQFAIFLPIVFLLYWFVFDRFISKSKHQLMLQNVFIVVASYVFYGWWDWRFLILIAFTSFCSWGSGLLIAKAATRQRAKTLMWVNVVINLLILIVFKYYNFFVSEFARLFHWSTDGLLLKVILPIGVSFYTFQALSYSIDVYRGKIEPTKDMVAFFAYIAFFPQLVAGPIERATHLLPQFLKRREFNYDVAVDGTRQILWGLFKKVAVADNCGLFVDWVFSTYMDRGGSMLMLGAVLFAFQIYGDFSGYSDIAIGTSKLFGIRLMRNFNVPYFSRDIAEFWRRWHISLNTWLRDYVYIPMGGSRVSKSRMILNTFVIFFVSSCWHGANWTFVAWGLFHTLLFLPLLLTGRNHKNERIVAEGRMLPTVKEAGKMFLTFFLVTMGWIFFRSESIGMAFEYFQRMIQWGTLRASYRFFVSPDVFPESLYIIIMLVVEWVQRGKEHGLSIDATKQVLPSNVYVRAVIFAALLFLVFLLGKGQSTFIYFQF